MRILALFVALTVPSFGCLDETVAKCNQRYGRPISIDAATKTCTYRKDGLEIKVRFRDAKAVVLWICHARKDTNGKPIEQLSETEIGTLLEANSGGSEWVHPATVDKSEGSKTADGKRIAHILAHLQIILITKEEKDKAAAEKKAAGERQNAEPQK